VRGLEFVSWRELEKIMGTGLASVIRKRHGKKAQSRTPTEFRRYLPPETIVLP